MAKQLHQLPRGRHVSTLLYETGWRHLASAPLQGTPNSIDIYAKNGRVIVVEEYGAEGKDGVELFYPSSQQKITDMIAEANAYANDATVTIGSNKVTFGAANMQVQAPIVEQSQRRAMLVYQGGIANVFEVAAFNVAEHGREARRLMQSDFRTCESFARGLAAAGAIVRSAACNQPGDIVNALWTDDLEGQPFSEKFRPVQEG